MVRDVSDPQSDGLAEDILAADVEILGIGSGMIGINRNVE